MEKTMWLRLCEAQFEKRVQFDKERWKKEAAEDCYESMYEDFPDDPEGAADEEMRCWDNDEPD